MSATAIAMQKIREEIEAPLRAEIDRLRAALAAIVQKHDYSSLDRGIGTALPEGKMWLEARAALEN